MQVSGRLHTLATFPMVPIEQEAEQETESPWMQRKKKKSLDTTRNQNLIPPLPQAVAKSL